MGASIVNNMIAPVYTSMDDEKEKDEVLENLKDSGKKLKKLFNINRDKIQDVIQELRKEWK